jgi:hypothetical protein
MSSRLPKSKPPKAASTKAWTANRWPALIIKNSTAQEDNKAPRSVSRTVKSFVSGGEKFGMKRAKLRKGLSPDALLRV